MNNEVLVIIYKSLMVGGIENYLIQLFERAITSGRRVIWICHKEKKVSPVYEKIVFNEKVEIVPIQMNGFGLNRIPKLGISKNEKITIFSFSIFNLYFGYSIREKYKNNIVKVFYVLPHFTGHSIFPEDAFPPPLYDCVRNIMSNIYRVAINSGSILFFDKRHYQELDKHYDIQIANVDRLMIKSIRTRPAFDELLVRKRFHNKRFIIISAGRFELPHKGYIIGLIKVFSELKNKYPHLKLILIGDGVDKNIVVKSVDALASDVKKDIEIRNPVSLEELRTLFLNCNLCISVAGCVNIAASSGLISLPARHYSYECEVYGFYPEGKKYTTSSEKGYPVRPFIEQVLSMDEETYLEYSKRAYDSFCGIKVDEDFPFNLPNDTSYSPSLRMRILLTTIKLFQKIIYQFQRMTKIC